MLSGWTRRLLQFLPRVKSQVFWYRTDRKPGPLTGVQKEAAFYKQKNPWESSMEFSDNEEEVDIFQLDKYYDQHQDEKGRKERIGKFKNVERKIIPGVVNLRLLSYKAQKQIQHLRENDPEMWSDEDLAKSFHVNTLAIRKVLKHDLSHLDSEEKIKRYDAVVVKNWRKLGFKKGPPESSVPTTMVQGLVVSAKPTYVKDKPIGPFQKIYVDHMVKTGKIQSTEEKNRIAADAAEILHAEQDEVFKNLPKIVRGDQFAPVTENKKGVQVRVSSGNIVQNERIELPHKTIAKHKRENVEFTLDKGTDGELVAYNFSHGKYERPFGWGTTEPDRISIPRQKRKRGALYKVGSSYYDDRGQFLYKIPMTL